MRKRTEVLLLGLVLLMGSFSWEVPAAAGDGIRTEEAAESVRQTWVNPIYRDVADKGGLREVIESAEEEEGLQEQRAGTAVSFQPMDKAAASLRRQMAERDNSITVYVQAGDLSIGSVASTLYGKAVAVDKETAGDEGDYITYHMGGYDSTTRSSYYGSGQYSVTYTIWYYTTRQQEAQVTAKVKKVLSSLRVKNMNTYGKIKTIYDYICKNVRYDYDTLYDGSVGKYTAYQALIKGKAVCQGYASLFYRMAMDAGVRARVMPGSSRSVPHAWNIVKLGSYYYNLDSTWDAGVKKYAYFLKSDKEFSDHVRDDAYRASSFKRAYPVSSTSYKNGAVIIRSDISKAKVSGIKAKTYTGKKCTQSPTLRSGNTTLKKDKDYTISYKDNVKIGTAVIILKGKGKYTGTIRKEFKITVKKGAVYKVGGCKYRIVNANTNGKGTVRLVGAGKRAEQVKIGGKRFKVL